MGEERIEPNPTAEQALAGRTSSSPGSSSVALFEADVVLDPLDAAQARRPGWPRRSDRAGRARQALQAAGQVRSRLAASERFFTFADVTAEAFSCGVPTLFFGKAETAAKLGAAECESEGDTRDHERR